MKIENGISVHAFNATMSSLEPAGLAFIGWQCACMAAARRSHEWAAALSLFHDSHRHSPADQPVLLEEGLKSGPEVAM